MPKGKSTLHNTHVKTYNIKHLSFHSTTPVLDHVSAKDMHYFCYAMKSCVTPSPDPSFKQSRLNEFNKLMERGVFCIVPRAEANGYQIYSARFVDEIKKVGAPEAFEKSRLVVQAYFDDANNYMIYASTV